MSQNFTPGWNDPPTKWTGEMREGGGTGDTKQLFNRRVAFPDTTQTAAAPQPINLAPLNAAYTSTGPPVVNMMMPMTDKGFESKATTSDTQQTEHIELDSALSDQQILQVFDSALDECAQITTNTRQSISRRLGKLKEALESQKLSAACREQISKLTSALSHQLYDQAYSIHSSLMIQHCSEVSAWMPGVKAVILECKKLAS